MPRQNGTACSGQVDDPVRNREKSEDTNDHEGFGAACQFVRLARSAGVRKMGVRLANKAALRAIFASKGNLTAGLKAERVMLDGVHIAPFLNNAGAAVSFSADLELNWAWRGRLPPEECDRKGRTERENVPLILKLCEENGIPVTWATVGHLFLEGCRREREVAHGAMPRPIQNNRWQGDWYLHDPCTNVKVDPLWYGPDLINCILGSSVRHEIGTHTFSHIKCSPECSSADLVRRELEACTEAMASYNITPKSLVYPHNIMGDEFLDVVAAAGIVAVRQRDEKVRLSYPRRADAGVYQIYESMNLRTPKYYDYLSKVKVFVEAAIHSGASFHLWFHPSDPPELFHGELSRIFRYVNEMRARKLVWVATMAELVAYCEARRQVRLRVHRTEKEVRVAFTHGGDPGRYGESELTLLIDIPRPPSGIVCHTATGVAATGANCIHTGHSRSQARQCVVSVPANCEELQVVL